MLSERLGPSHGYPLVTNEDLKGARRMPKRTRETLCLRHIVADVPSAHRLSIELRIQDFLWDTHCYGRTIFFCGQFFATGVPNLHFCKSKVSGPHLLPRPPACTPLPQTSPGKPPPARCHGRPFCNQRTGLLPPAFIFPPCRYSPARPRPRGAPQPGRVL